MKHLPIFNLLNSKTLSSKLYSTVAKLHSSKPLVLKLLFSLWLISYSSTSKSQVVEHPPITICAGEELVLSNFSWPPDPPDPDQGPGGTPRITCDYVIERTIHPTEGLIERNSNSFTVAPSTTTFYYISSYYVVGPQAPDSYYHNTEDCPQGDWVDDYFEIIVEECSNTICDVNDPFTDFTWLEELINFEDDNGFGYYDYAKLYDIDGNSYLEVFSELTGGGSQIYTCDGSLFCERQDSLNCNQFNETTLVETLYDSKCTPTADESEAGDNKIDIEAVKVNYPTYVSSEGERNFSFEFKNNGPCRLFETDFAIEMNGTVIETKKVTGSISNGKTFTVRSDEEYYFEPEIEYILKVYPVNPNGNSDLNFTNDTLTRVYNFNRDYRFDINQFVSPQAIAFDGQQEVSLAFANYSNASIVDEVYVNWSVNGIEQSPVAIEDIQGENTLVLGDYYFEVDKDYEIKASIEMPTYSNLPVDQIYYVVEKNTAKTDLAIVSVERSTINTDIISVRIENNGNVDINDFIINWTYNGVSQEPIEGSNYNWRSYAEKIFFEKYVYVSVPIDSFNLDEGIKHTFDFSVNLPGNYTDEQPGNNFFTYEIEPLAPGEEKPDQVYKICEGDSITLQVREFTYYPDSYGISLGCTECEVSFNNQEWTVSDRIITGTNSITIKPNVTSIITFSTDAFENCFRSCGGGPSGSSSGSYDQPDVRIKVIVEACPKQEANCLNNLGKVGNNNEIRSFNGDRFWAYDVDGNYIFLNGDYLQFDYEIKGPVLTDGSYQPITITCLEEIYEDIPVQGAYFDELCPGDEIQESLKIHPQIGTKYNALICDILQTQSINNSFIESSFSDDCVFNFTVNDISEERYASVNYNVQLQTVDKPQPFNLIWNFGFEYQDDCAIACSNTPGLMQTASTFVCAGVSVFVGEAFSAIDENSVKAYVLHQEKEFDGINYITMQQESRFTSPGSTYTNQTLYISSVMGPAGENGMPILNNACTVWTPYGARYTFFDPVNIHVEDERCENGAYYVDVSLSGGLGALSSNMSYRSVFDGIKTYENLTVGEVVTFGPYEGTGEYHITAKGAKGCQAEYLGTYNCDVTHRNASINWGGSNIFEIKYTNPDLVIEAVQIFRINGQSVQANIQMDNNSCEIELQNQINGSLFFVQLLVRDRRTEKSFSVSEKLYKN